MQSVVVGPDEALPVAVAEETQHELGDVVLVLWRGRRGHGTKDGRERLEGPMLTICGRLRANLRELAAQPRTLLTERQS